MHTILVSQTEPQPPDSSRAVARQIAAPHRMITPRVVSQHIPVMAILLSVSILRADRVSPRQI